MIVEILGLLFKAVVMVVAAYGVSVYAIKMIKDVSIQESKALVKAEIRAFFKSSPADIPLSEAETKNIIKAILPFNMLEFENTRWRLEYWGDYPALKVEIFDRNFLEDFPVIRQNILGTLGRKFYFSNIDWLAYVDYEETLTENLYYVAVYWATTRKSKKHLQKRMENTAEYNRREDLAKHQPTVDEELEREMERNDRG